MYIYIVNPYFKFESGQSGLAKSKGVTVVRKRHEKEVDYLKIKNLPFLSF